MQHSTISLIGMPGTGKSTVGVILAKRVGLSFRDSDLDIQQREGASLQQILEQHGYQYLRQLEEEVLLSIPLHNTVLATGGSAVYSDAVMQRLQSLGPIVYLATPLSTLEQRVNAAPKRGIASDQEQSFASIYAQRSPLYEKYADLTINGQSNSADQIAERITQAL